MNIRWTYLFLALSACGWAQEDLSNLQGTVRDPSGALMSNVNVVLKDAVHHQERRSVSNAEGAYRIAEVRPGHYTLEIDAPGFASKVVEDLRLEPGQTTTYDETLATGTLVQKVDVAANTQTLQLSNATATSVLTTKELVNTPSPSRNYTQLIVAEAGVSAPLPDRTGKGLNIATAPGAQGDDATQSLNPSVNGARPSNNAVMIDGVDATNMMNGGGGLGNNLNVPLDALETVETQTALFSASSGRNGGANVNILTRGGTNQFHGSAYTYLQNEKLNANEFFLNSARTARPQFRRNETGITVGGPVFRDRTYFFASLARTNFASGYASNAIATTTLPTGLTDTRNAATIAATTNQWLREGAADNRQFLPNLRTLLSTWPAAQRDGILRKFFSDPNMLALRTIQPSDISPVSLNILNAKRNGQYLIPSPTSTLSVLPSNGTYSRESLLQQVIPTTYNAWNGTATIEQNLTQNNRLRLNYVHGSQNVEEAFGWADASPSPTYGITSSYIASLADYHNFGPNWFNELRGGFFELNNSRLSKYKDFTNSSLGIYNPLEIAFGGFAADLPTIDINTQRNSGGIGNAWNFYDRQRVIDVTDIVSHPKGSHNIQFGGEFRRPTIRSDYQSRTNGDLDYDNWALFFIGKGAVGGGSDLDQGDTRRHFKMRDYMTFVQDDWKVRPGLTINAGLRYEFFGNPSDTEGRIGNYYLPSTAAKLGVDPGFYVPGNSAIFKPGFTPFQLGLLVAPSVNLDYSQVHKSPTDSTLQDDRNNFAPRFGFAWQPQSKKAVVVRGGYGVFFERPSGSYIVDMQHTAPFFVYQNVPAPANNANPYPSLNINPFQIPLGVQIVKNANGSPSFVRADGTPFPATEPFSAKSNIFIDPFIKTPYQQQWSLGVQLEPFGGNIVDLKYVGSAGSGLVAKLNFAQPQDPRVTPVNGFNNIRDKTGALIDPSFFVNPQFLGLSKDGGFQVRGNYGHSTYHAFQFALKRRLAKGLTWNVAYTFSKALDNVSNDTGLIEQDAFNGRLNKGRADFNRTHRFTTTVLGQIPTFWRRSAFTRGLTGGWSLSSFITLQSGLPFSPLGAPTMNAQFAQPSRVRLDFAPGKTLADATKSGAIEDRLNSYYDVSAFTNSLDHWGNAGRNILQGPPQTEIDAAIAKQTVLRESVRMEFRWEMFNIANTAVFANPASTFAAGGAGTAGQITATIGGPRTMQGSLRIGF